MFVVTNFKKLSISKNLCFAFLLNEQFLKTTTKNKTAKDKF